MFKKSNRNLILFCTSLVILFFLSFLFSYTVFKKKNMTLNNNSDISLSSVDTIAATSPKDNNIPIKTKTIDTEVILTSVGDCTIGYDDKFSFAQSLPAVLQRHNNDYSYFFKNVQDIFKHDDITTANLETTFTDSTLKAKKEGPISYNFRGNPQLAKVLSSGSIEGVNLSNNHIKDYLDKGFEDTKLALEAERINYFGEGYKWVKEIKGNKIAFLGYKGFSYDKSFLNNLKKDIQDLKKDDCTVIINFHWGEENAYYPNDLQKYLAHFSIDNGADLIIGHHPHVIQGVEMYKGRVICYSLGNFCFGGNNNPVDKDTYILQSVFKFTNNKLTSYGIKFIPCSISSVNYINDYCPSPLNGDKKDQLLYKLNRLSKGIDFQLKDQFTFFNVNN